MNLDIFIFSRLFGFSDNLTISYRVCFEHVHMATRKTLYNTLWIFFFQESKLHTKGSKVMLIPRKTMRFSSTCTFIFPLALSKNCRIQYISHPHDHHASFGRRCLHHKSINFYTPVTVLTMYLCQSVENKYCFLCDKHRIPIYF